ncbi:MAG TPA: acyl-CoA thioesterase [Pyrinomonadaceae bacterium]|nr:acyl-CoA thioesterase [Acidobacteriota bacterium]HQZ97909.1 acyl-CoA thioesterase [Pyrinomonadaceae bacterium]
MSFSHSFTVKDGEIDELGHVNNVAYLQWVQDIAVAHWNAAATDEHKERFIWVVVRHEIDYKRPAFAGEEVTAETWVGEWTSVTCERFTEVRRGDAALVKARTLWCMFDRQKNRPAKIGQDLIDRFI